jgi:hypothetical protein
MSGPDEEAERRRRLHDLERGTARKPEDPGPGRPDPIHVIRARRHDQPGIAHFGMARWSLIARLVRDAEGSGDEVADLGPDALMLCQAAQRGQWGPGEIAWVGIADERAGRWLRWNPPAPVEPVPGSPGEQAQRN